MLTRRCLLIIAAGVSGGNVRAQPAHALVGTWRGTIIGFAEPQARTLVVRSVASDGGVEATWANVSVTARWQGAELTLTTGAGNPVSLKLSAPDTLQGWFTTNRGTGRRYSVVMNRG